MVKFGPLQVRLVHAENHRPFLEHDDDDADDAAATKRFVEVEPEAEYYIAVKKIKETNVEIIVDIYVDNKRVASEVLDSELEQSKNDYFGVKQRGDSCSYRALKFVPPPIREEEEEEEAHDDGKKTKFTKEQVVQTMMGNVRIVVSEAKFRTRRKEKKPLLVPTMTPETITLPSHLSNRKAMRSTVGRHRTTVELEDNNLDWYPTKHLESFTFHYGTAQALMLAGILSQARQKTTTMKKKTKNQVTPERQSSPAAMECIDLTIDDDDDDDDYHDDPPIFSRRLNRVTPERAISARAARSNPPRRRHVKRKIIDLT
eukprot:CAMPEP_0168719576 /NCGR_PEP_ID=MMETSP0724-20121128/1109_1 /TAXON_ID=265536 /ORGANISM="Amphiprora sp., Strain CCMP467" /LENGTH=314 /DNA_ID=CAMNT_0008766133 /DNA_START=36 /DNA_END=980 /DNA_ORIENTATION=+